MLTPLRRALGSGLVEKEEYIKKIKVHFNIKDEV